MHTEPRPGQPGGEAPVVPLLPTELPRELLEEIYDELRAVARRTLAGWHAQSVNATALVHEAWEKMRNQECYAGLDRAAYLSVAALSIRRILVDHCREKQTAKRGGDRERVPLFDSLVLDSGPSIDLLALDEALRRLAEIEPRRAQVVDLRYFGGLTEPEVAEALGVSLRTVADDWRFARAWLARRLGEGGAE